MAMITFTEDSIRFVYRIVGVAIDAGRVLLHRAESDDFWALPGGRAELLEPAAETLYREMCEELGIAVQVVRLLWVVENFFEYKNLRFHELGMYFLMQVPEDWTHRPDDGPFLGQEGHIPLIFQWFPLGDLKNMRVYPSFLADGLLDLPLAPRHVVHVDELPASAL